MLPLGLSISPLARRITSLKIDEPLSLREWHAISTMTALRSIDAWMTGDATKLPANCALLPPSPTSLDLRFADGMIEPRLIDAAADSATLRHLRLLLRPDTNIYFPELDLSPLRRSRSLTALQLDAAPTAHQVADLKQISTLHRLLVPRDFWFEVGFWNGLRMDLHHFEMKSAGVSAQSIEKFALHAPNLTQPPSGFFFRDALHVLSSLKKLKQLRIQPGLPAQHRGDSDRKKSSTRSLHAHSCRCFSCSASNGSTG